MIYHTIALAAGFILDLIFGDPRWLYHPVCLIGNLISFLEKRIRKILPKTSSGELTGGLIEVLIVCILSLGIPAVILYTRTSDRCLPEYNHGKLPDARQLREASGPPGPEYRPDSRL